MLKKLRRERTVENEACKGGDASPGKAQCLGAGGLNVVACGHAQFKAQGTRVKKTFRKRYFFTVFFLTLFRYVRVFDI